MTPELSVIVVGDCAESLAGLLAAVEAQTDKARIEVIVVAPGKVHRAIRPLIPSGLAGSRFIDRTPLRAMSPAKADGVKAARAGVLVFTETHAFPGPDWARALIEAHSAERCAAVGPALINANPGPLSDANMLLDYGPFLADGHQQARAVPDLPGHNSSYRRDLLLGYGERLEGMLDLEIALHEDLRRRGLRLVLEPRARIAHVNVTRARSWLPERWHAGRIYAGIRCQEWPAVRRLIYTLAAPAIPLVRLVRAGRDARRSGQGAMLAQTLPFVLIGLAVQCAGEAYGYTRGPGSRSQLFLGEMRRFDHVKAGDPLRVRARLRAELGLPATRSTHPGGHADHLAAGAS